MIVANFNRSWRTIVPLRPLRCLALVDWRRRPDKPQNSHQADLDLAHLD
jgi:hypothetical protein